ncbi:MAG: glycosyltransferase, partial [Actinomyces sp.]
MARRLVVDVDDAVWVSRAAATYAARFDHAARLADLVVAGGHHLAAEISGRVATPVEVVPAAIDLAAVRPGDGERTGPPTFVWTGSGPNYADFDDEVVAALRNATAAGARIRFVSDRPPPFAVEHELTLWTPEAEAAALAASDIGLMPLRDEPRSRGRCGYKAALYLAAGLPVVAADVGVAPEIVGDVGALVEPGGWSGTLAEIVRRPDQWRRLAPRARARAE